MTKNILTKEDIKRIWDNLIVISWDNATEIIAGGGIRPIIMSNGYSASLSLDILSERVSMYHLSVNSADGNPDPIVAENMAREIIGEGYFPLTVGKISGCIQFMNEKKHVDNQDIKGDRKKEARKKEAKRGKRKIEEKGKSKEM